MANTFPTIQATAQFAKALRARALASRVVNRDLDNAPASLGETLSVSFSTPQAPVAVTPGHAPTAAQDFVRTKVDISVDKLFERSMAVTDKELAQIEAGHVPAEMEQMAIDLVEKVNSDIYAAAVIGAGSAMGTAGTNPFATDEQPLLDAYEYLDTMKASQEGRIAIFNPPAWWKAMKVSNIAQADRRGDATNPLVTGDLGALYGSPVAMDQLIATTTVNALGTGALTVNGVNAAGATSISIAKAAGANWSAKAGDVLTIAGQDYKYVVASDTTVTQGANTSVPLTRPLAAATAGGEAVTLSGSATTYKNSLVMHRDGVKFVSRPLNELTAGGLSAADRYVFNDPQTGLSIRAELQRQHYQSKLSFSILYGVKVIRPVLVARIMG